MKDSRRNSQSLLAYVICGIIVFLSAATVADIRLPAIIGDNMVLQHDKEASIWGWADPGEEVGVSVSWHRMKWAVTADGDGRWRFRMAVPKMRGRCWSRLWIVSAMPILNGIWFILISSMANTKMRSIGSTILTENLRRDIHYIEQRMQSEDLSMS